MQIWCVAVSLLVAETHSCRSNCGDRGIRNTLQKQRDRLNVPKIRIAPVAVRIVPPFAYPLLRHVEGVLCPSHGDL